jgi:transposase-like protein
MSKIEIIQIKPKYPNCPHCQQSDEVVKFGKFEGIQRYWCKTCKRKFTGINNLPKMKTPIRVIASAMSCYFSGMPLDAIQRHLQQQYGIYMDESGIYRWVIRFSKEAVNKTKDYKPDIGNTWIADETMINVGKTKVWFWDIIDLRTRYLLASHISLVRTSKDAARLMRKAAQRAGKTPKKVITDKLAAYLDGVEIAFGADTEHVQSKPFTVVESTNVIERFHGTLKQRTKIIKRFKNLDTAKIITDAWLVHYNFFKEHESLGNMPPARKMGKVPIKDWADVLEQTRADMLGQMPKVTVKPKSPVIHSYTKTETFNPKRSEQYIAKSGDAILMSRRKPKGAKVVGRTKGRYLK